MNVNLEQNRLYSELDNNLYSGVQLWNAVKPNGKMNINLYNGVAFNSNRIDSSLQSNSCEYTSNWTLIYSTELNRNEEPFKQ